MIELPDPTKLSVLIPTFFAITIPADWIPILKPPPAVTIPANAAAPFDCIVPAVPTNNPPPELASVVSPTTSPPWAVITPTVLILPSLYIVAEVPTFIAASWSDVIVVTPVWVMSCKNDVPEVVIPWILELTLIVAVCPDADAVMSLPVKFIVLILPAVPTFDPSSWTVIPWMSLAPAVFTGAQFEPP